MSLVTSEQRDAFFSDVRAASAKAVWCALATVSAGEPRVRIVHPTWDGEVLWLVTQAGAPKLAQIEAQPIVDVQFQVAPPDFVHILVRGKAAHITDAAEKKRVWNVMDYDLGMFWKGGFDDPAFAPIRIDPTRVEHSLMFGSAKKRVWRR